MEEEMKPVEETKEEIAKEADQLEPMDTSEAISFSANDTKSDLNLTGEKNELEIKSEPRVRKKRKKSKKVARSKDYPKYYQNAYVRYCNETRPKICESRPELDPVSTTKLVASMWYALPPDEKQPYLDSAKIDKERFKKELKEFNKNQVTAVVAENDESAVKSTKKKKGRKSQLKSPPASPIPLALVETNFDIPPQLPTTSTHKPTVPVAPRKDDDFPRAFINTNCELPIFTDAFLEHNKVIESELKILRKNNIEMELQNSVLMKHIENMENGVRKVDSEVAMTKKRNTHLEVYLTKMKCLLAANFHSLSIPGAGKGGGATVENIEKYMTDLANETKKPHSSAINKAREILKNVDLKIVT
jgi:high mobility group protein 20A